MKFLQAAKKFIRTLTYSLTTRLLLLFIIISISMTALVTGSLMHGFSSQWQYNIRPHLLNYLAYISEEIGIPPNIDAAKKLADDLPINIYIYGKGINFSSTGKQLELEDLEFRRHDKPWRERHFKPKRDKDYHLNANRDSSQLKGTIAFGEYHDRTILLHRVGPYRMYYELSHQKRRNQQFSVLQKTLITLLIIFIISYLILRYLLRPIRDIDKGVSQMRNGELTYEIPVRKDNDLGELASSINSMAQEIDHMLDAKRQLLLAVSHELRSPLTRAKLAIQMMDESNHREAIEQDLEEMERLINEILEAERINGPHSSLHITAINISDFMTQIVSSFDENTLTLALDNNLSTAHWDETRIRLLLRNIINNAIHYSQGAEQVPQISISQNKQSVDITVKDYGSGISEADLGKITEPFYRVDPSRTRATGGFGLGLYLCKLIVEAHKGELLFESQLNEGTTVTINLPLTPHGTSET